MSSDEEIKQKNAEKNDENTASSHLDNDNIEGQHQRYNGRKPKWWKSLAGRRATKGQRGAISRMTERGFVIPTLGKYQHELDMLAIFRQFRGVSQADDEDNDVFSGVSIGPLKEDRILLPRKSLTNNQPSMDICVEIGFGSGENLLQNARNFPGKYYIGCEIHQPGVGVALGQMEKELGNGDHYTTNNSFTKSNNIAREIQPPFTNNLRIYRGDGVKFLNFIPDSSLVEIYLTFPDPWPNPGQSQWRVVQEDTVHLMERVLKPGVGKFYLATDSVCFNDWTHKIFKQVVYKHMNEGGEAKWLEETPCLDRQSWLPIVSKYEEKGMKEGRSTLLQCWKYCR
mmetsp:Transcript_14152/g.20215  ORF Transcript_14152/g.20215 Transcript_14152/m.20215 type:complete len:340 (-) Transcript_14152:2-1021(-)